MIKKLLHKKPVRYLTSGLLTALTEYGSFIILTHVIANIVLDNAMSFTLSLFVGFTLNKLWVFQAVGNHKRQAFGYLLLASINLIFSSLLIWFIAEVLKLNPFFAKLGVMAIIAGSNYLLFSKLIFRLKSV